MKTKTSWYSERLEAEMPMVRYGHYGIPLLLFPTAGGDCEELERFHLIGVLEPWIQDGRIKVFSVDSIAGRTWITDKSIPHRVWVQKQFDAYIRHEVVPAIWSDCQSNELPIITAGASIGAFNALAIACRYPDLFRRAICMSGTYDLERWLEGQWFDDFHFLSPVHFVPGLGDSEQLRSLQSSFFILATGEGLNEDPEETWKVAHALGGKNIPNRVDLWGAEWPHDWQTWREMLPQYVEEVLNSFEA